MYGVSPQAYDRAITVFSPDGRLFQVEYAKEAVKKGSIAIAIASKEGVVLTAYKSLNNPLVIPSSLQKVFKVDDNIAITASGLIADARKLIDYAIKEANKHKLIYNEDITVYRITKEISDIMQAYTQYGGARPFGVSLLIVGVDDEARVYEAEPSGAFTGYKATAIGNGRKEAEAIIAKEYSEKMSIDDSLKLAMKALKEAVEGKVDVKNIEAAVITLKEKKMKYLGTEEIKKYL